jgi:hypothetical protein
MKVKYLLITAEIISASAASSVDIIGKLRPRVIP